MKVSKQFLLFASIFTLSSCVLLPSQKASEESQENSGQSQGDSEGGKQDEKGKISKIDVTEEEMEETLDKHNQKLDLIKSFNLTRFKNTDEQSKNRTRSTTYTDDPEENVTYLTKVYMIEDYLNNEIEAYTNFFKKREPVVKGREITYDCGSFIINETNKRYDYFSCYYDFESDVTIYDNVVGHLKGNKIVYLISDDRLEIYSKCIEQDIDDDYVDPSLSHTYQDTYLSVRYSEGEIVEVKGTTYDGFYTGYNRHFTEMRKSGNDVIYVDYDSILWDPRENAGEVMTVIRFMEDMVVATTFSHHPGTTPTGFFEDDTYFFHSIQFAQQNGGVPIEIYPFHNALYVPMPFINGFQSMTFPEPYYANGNWWIGIPADSVQINNVVYEYDYVNDPIMFYDFIPVSTAMMPTNPEQTEYRPTRLALGMYFEEDGECLENFFMFLIDYAAERMGVELNIPEPLRRVLGSLQVGDLHSKDKVFSVSSQEEIEKFSTQSIGSIVNPEANYSDAIKLAVEEIITL